MSTKLKCVLLDDEMPGLSYLKLLCEQIAELDVVKAYNDPQKFLKEATDLDFDLCILDIEMPNVSGVQVASRLQEKLVIFATAYREYAADAFELDAVDFVQKPVTKERLQVAINKAITRRSLARQSKRYFQLNTDKGKALLSPDDLAYITTSEIDSRDKVAVMLDNSSMVLKNVSFKRLQDHLPHKEFCRINKRQLIAMRIVASFTFDQITTNVNGEGMPLRLSISEAYRQEFQRRLKGIS